MNWKNNQLENYKEVMVPNYLPANFIPKKALGSKVWDSEDKEYIDFGGGIAVNSLGHSNPELVKALKDQSEKLWHLSNFIASEGAINLGKKLTKNTFADKVFFSNSGSEANETAIKIVRKFHSSINSSKTEIISFNNSFHGRSVLNISLGGTEDSSQEFSPLVGNIKHAEFNDIESVKNLMSEKTAAIIIEPVQGETGIVEAKREFLQEIRSLCNEYQTSLVFDEVQSGVGRTGYLYAYMKYGVEPDILTSAKGLGGGFPIGVTLVKNELAKTLQPGSHGSTFGGNHLACAVANKVIDIVNNQDFLEEVKNKERIIRSNLEDISSKYELFSDIRSSGLWFGCDLIKDRSSFEFLDLGYEEGLILVPAGPNKVRLAPALNIEEKDILEGMDRLERVASKF
ncbi:MAG: acetylornithine/succinyldiaminopimelate transaminase [Gammaproteobacteria bacterium]